MPNVHMFSSISPQSELGLPSKTIGLSRFLHEPANEFGHPSSQIICLVGRVSHDLWGGSLMKLRYIASYLWHETVCLHFFLYLFSISVSQVFPDELDVSGQQWSIWIRWRYRVNYFQDLQKTCYEIKLVWWGKLRCRCCTHLHSSPIRMGRRFSDIFLLPDKAIALSRILFVTHQMILGIWPHKSSFLQVESHVNYGVVAWRSCGLLHPFGAWDCVSAVFLHSKLTAIVHIPVGLVWNFAKVCTLRSPFMTPRFSFPGISQGCLLRSKNPLWPKNTKTTNFPSYCDKYPFTKYDCHCCNKAIWETGKGSL